MRNLTMGALGFALLAPLAVVSTALATEFTVTIAQMKFGPVPAAVHVGDTIVWQNNDILRHTATARDGSFNVDLPPGTSAKTVIGQAGSLAFFCKFHPGMTGTLVASP